MAQLSAKDLRAALDFVGEVNSFDDLDAFRSGILPGLERLIPCNLVGYNEVGGAGPALVITHPEPMLPFAGEALSQLAHEHPLISVQANGDRRAYKISDFLSRRQFHSLALYTDLYCRIEAEDQIAVGLPGPQVIGVAANRDRGSFSERDRDMLDLLGPHLALARDRILERAQARAMIAALEQAARQGGSEAILLDRGGGVVGASGEALALLRAYLPGVRGTSPGHELAGWLERGGGDPALGPGRDPLTVTSERGRLTVSEMAARGLDGRVLLLTEERAVTPAALERLGLTPRQAEVLALLAAGSGTAEIAAALFISPATARKHFEHIYERLGVHSRIEAVSIARRAPCPSSPEEGSDGFDGHDVSTSRTPG
jgi:DNA-binding CsgD family transcriptional regulator